MLRGVGCEPTIFFESWIFDNFANSSAYRNNCVGPTMYCMYICMLHQGCQMVCFKTKNEIRKNLGGACNGRYWLYILCTFWSILRPFDIFYGLLIYFVVVRYIFPLFWYIVPRQIWQPSAPRVLGWHVMATLKKNLF
jgi:hypothetical protein